MNLVIVAAAGIGGFVLAAALWVTARGLAAGYVPARRPACHACGAAMAPRVWLPGLGGRGRCAACGASTGGRPRLALEVALAVAFAVAAWRMDTGPAIAFALFSVPLIVIGLTDALTGFVFRNLAIGGLLLGVVAAALAGLDAIDSALIGAGAGLAIFGALMLLARSILPAVRLAPIGGGDVLVAGMIGAMAGWPGVLFALAAGVATGGIGAAVVLVRRRDEQARVVPFGPFLCAAALAVFLVWF